MSHADEVFELFVAANPVPDITALHTPRPPTSRFAVELGPPDLVIEPVSATSRHRQWLVAAAVVAAALVAAGLWFGRSDDAIEQQPIDAVDPDELIERDATAKAVRWLEAANAGDVEAIVAISHPSSTDLADRRLFEWLGGLADGGLPTRVGACETDPSASPVIVRCDIVLVNPVADELGVDRLVAPFRYEDGLLTWLPYTGGDIGLHNEAVSAYLARFEPEAYEQACLPGAYDPGSVVSDRGLALTGECAVVAAPLAEDVAEWLRAGRPEP